jgi:hypothetical protein
MLSSVREVISKVCQVDKSAIINTAYKYSLGSTATFEIDFGSNRAVAAAFVEACKVVAGNQAALFGSDFTTKYGSVLSCRANVIT